MGKMPMPRQATTGSFSSSPLRPCAFALLFSSAFPSPPSTGRSIPQLCAPHAPVDDRAERVVKLSLRVGELFP